MGINENKVFPLVRRRPKSEGGLGIRKNNDANKAAITKLGLGILTDKDSIWARIMRHKYVKDNNFHGDSIGWKEIINHRKYIGDVENQKILFGLFPFFLVQYFPSFLYFIYFLFMSP